MKSIKNIYKTGALLSLVLFSSFTNHINQTNDNPLAGWDKNVIRQANSAIGASYLSEQEKKLIFYTNLCRLNPSLFCQTVLADYLQKHPDQGTDETIVDALKKQLMQEKPCGALAPDEQLCTIAHDFAKKMGEEGKTGHADFKTRMQPVMNRYNVVGENCSYGNPIGEDAFMSLLIDKSDPVNLAHRKNILDTRFLVIGVSGQAHKVYKWNYVMDFGGK